MVLKVSLPEAKLSCRMVILIALFILKHISLTHQSCSHSRNLQHSVHCFTLCDAVLLDQNLDHQQPTEAREKSHRERKNDISDVTDLYIRYATELDEREG